MAAQLHRIMGKITLIISLLILDSQVKAQNFCFDFYGDTFNFSLDPSVEISFSGSPSEQKIKSFYNTLSKGNYQPIITSLLSFKQKKQLNDWLYYQLIRRTAQQISPKAENYERYTLYKWFFLAKSGYDAKLAIENEKLLFYVWSNEDVSDIPFYTSEGKQYVCLNIHDFAKSSERNKLHPLNIKVDEAKYPFSYKVTHMPNFKPEDYTVKTIRFKYRRKAYEFDVKLNTQVQAIFANYPVVDFDSYFNIPLSRETYSSLIPTIRQNIKGLSQKKGIDYLMRFTRNAFEYKDDEENFGKEKRLSPEQTLLNDQSDCDDRVALFYYLVKEIYNLPMIALLYPTHITMAVQFDKPVGESIVYNGKKYSICEATPQGKDLRIGQILAKHKNAPFEVVYQYDPIKN